MRTSFQICILSLVALIIGVAAPRVNAQCSADLNADHSVTAQDLAIMLAFWGPTTTFAAADINQDQVVNAQDLAMLLAMWGPCPPPVLPWATVLEQDPNPAVVTDANFRQRMIATGLPWRVRDNGTGIEMLLIPLGTFWMGCTPGDSECGGEGPVHQVTLTNSYYLGKTEVTQGQWLPIMGSNPSTFQQPAFPSDMTYPVESVSWIAIQAFVAATDLRLPTEAEWEYACRAGTTTARYGPVNSIAWHYGNTCESTIPPSFCGTRPVATKLPNALGLHDMLGNLAEVCQDWWGPYSSAPATNPTGPRVGQYHVLRGSGFFYYGSWCTASWRADLYPDGTASYVGFRVARNP